MKIKIIFLVIVTAIFTANAQVNNKLCLEKISNVETLLNQNKHSEAQKIWLETNKNCANTTENFFLHGEKIYNFLIEASNDQPEKLLQIDGLIKLYDQYNSKFPENLNDNNVKKGLLLYENKIGTNDQTFSVFDTAFKRNNSNFRNPNALYYYFELCVDQYKQGKNGLTTDDLYDKKTVLEQNISSLKKEKQEFILTLENKQKSETLSNADFILLKNAKDIVLQLQNVSEGYKSLIEPYITCDNFISYSKNKFEVNMNNVFWLEYVSNTLFTKGCVSDKIFSKIVSKWDDLNSTAKSKYYLGYNSVVNNQTEQAEIFFNEAANLSNENSEKAKTYYTIATIVYGIKDNVKANQYIQKALEVDPSYAKAYLFLAQLYENSINECANTDFERKAMYWLIAATVTKAGEVDKRFEESSKLQTKDYLTKSPTKTEIAKSGKSGKKITIGCWINQTIEVPKS